ncbi:MAG: 2-dehydropantoate 2-reductase [Steroidobacteraceae bacterium]
MKITVFGAGSVGGHVAGRLVLSGQEVNVVARGAHLKAIQDNGLTLNIEAQSNRCVVNATDDGAVLGTQDLVIVAVKGNTLAAAVPQIRKLVGPQTHVLFLMNGLPAWFLHGSASETPALRDLLDPQGNIAGVAAHEQIIWGVINSGGTIEQPGVIRSTTPKNNAVKLGQPEGASGEFVQPVAALLSKAGYTAEISTNIRRDIWQKLAVNIGLALTAAVLEWDNRATVADPETRGVVIGCLREMAAIGKAIGIEIATNFETTMDPARIAPHRSSFLQDLSANRPMELSTTILAVREIARAAAVQAPHVITIAALIDGRARAGAGA